MVSSGMKQANIKKILGHNRYINQENLEIVLFITNLYIHQSINVVSLKRMWVHNKSNHSEKDKKGENTTMTLTFLEYIFSCAFRNTFFDVNRI